MAIQNIVSNGMPLMGAMEERIARCVFFCWKWKDFNSRQEKISRSDRFGLGCGGKPSSGSVSQWYGLGRRI